MTVMKMITRCYTELSRIRDYKERYEYLKLGGEVGRQTFGHDRYINQGFYTSYEWKHVRNSVIARDLGCDMGVEGYEIFDKVYIHHMNPMTPDSIIHDDPTILDPEFLISVSHQTHNAIHYGDARLLKQLPVDRRPGDTKLW